MLFPVRRGRGGPLAGRSSRRSCARAVPPAGRTGGRPGGRAARRGEPKTVDWLLRRLRAIHALTPVLLSAEPLEGLPSRFVPREPEARLRGPRALIARERAVADRISWGRHLPLP